MKKKLPNITNHYWSLLEKGKFVNWVYAAYMLPIPPLFTTRAEARKVQKTNARYGVKYSVVKVELTAAD